MKIGKKRLAALFDEWQRRYIENPESFYQDWTTIQTRLEEEASGAPLSYGTRCVRYILEMDRQVAS